MCIRRWCSLGKWYEFYKNKFTLAAMIRILIAQFYLLLQILKYKPKNVLEVGFGTLTASTFLSYFGIDVISLDKDVSIVRKVSYFLINIKKRNKPTLIIGDAFYLPFKDKSFDCVFSQGLLEHFNDNEILRIIKEQLRVGRRVYISVPNQNYPRKVFGDERLMSKEEWESILSKLNNVRIVKSVYYGRLRTWYGLKRLFFGKPVELLIVVEGVTR